jgi:alanyl-tRNA synthetase
VFLFLFACSFTLGFFSQLVHVVVVNFSDAFPELGPREEFVKGIISDEENSFNRTLDQGVKHFKKVVALLGASGNSKEIPAKEAHVLFTSMGFPLDLTELMAAEKGFTVDKKGFDNLMENDRDIAAKAEAARKGTSSKDLSMEAEQTSYLINKNIPTTDSTLKYTWNISPEVQVVGIFVGKNVPGFGNGFTEEFSAVSSSSSGSDAGEMIGLILDQTSFYYESGGQTYDTGSIISSNGMKFEVKNCQSYAGYIVHCGILHSGKVTLGSKVQCQVDYDRRSNIAPNHTMTHVLNFALRKVLLGDNSTNAATAGQCEQRGSLVDADKLRFDFSWSTGLTVQEISQIESIVNAVIDSNIPVHNDVVSLADASKINSLRKVFGEAYPDPVRIISVGQSIDSLLENPNDPKWYDISVEFCGGTHLTNTKNAERFVIIEESGIAKGIRRIVGYTRKAAIQAKNTASSLVESLKTLETENDGNKLIVGYKQLKKDVDTAVVSVVDKDAMRSILNKIFEKIKVFNKANASTKLNNALTTITNLANQAIQENKVRELVSCYFSGSFTYYTSLFYLFFFFLSFLGYCNC